MPQPLPLALALAVPALHAAAAVDVQALWDFKDPAASEQRFRDRLATADANDRAILQTQIARTHGLRRRFDEARAVLAPLQPQLATLGPEANVRFHLERGRAAVSATHRPADITPDARQQARADYLRAFDLARQAGLDDLAVDALHMLPFVDTDPDSQLKWTRQALDLCLASTQSAARRWEASLRGNLGVHLHDQGRHAEALAMFRDNLPVTEKTGDTSRIRVAHWMVAWTLRALGRLDEALAMQLKLEADNARDATPDPYVFEELAALYQAKGDAAKAAAYQRLQEQHSQKPTP